VEWIASLLALIAIAGVYFPIPSAVLGLVIFLARIIYTLGYLAGGPRGRIFGALGNHFAFLGVAVLAIVSSIFFIVGRDI